MPEGYDPVAIATELGECRQRGLDWLDHSSGTQVRVRAEGLQRLAEAYVAARELVTTGRIAQIKILLRDGIGELSRQGHESDARLLQDLFFGEATNGPIRPPGELLKLARSRTGDSTETRFRERRTTVFRSFAQFLITFAAVSPGVSAAPAWVQGSGSALGHAHQAITGYVGDNEHFIQLLAEAVNVTIVGITNERLVTILQEALRRKRAAGQPDAFWGSLRIVFLEPSLLAAVDDEREEFQDSREALRQRRLEAVWARRSLACFLRRAQSTRWALYGYPYLPLLTGCLLEFDNRKSLVHLLIRRPRRPTADHRFIELEDLRDQYFSAVFEDIVRDSIEDNKVVPVGVPTGSSFQCKEIRLLKNVLKDKSNATGWLPVVLAVTSRQRGGQVEAMLQLRTEDNSARELNRLSHLCTHILQQDRMQQTAPQSAAPSFALSDEIPLSAARRLVIEDTGDDQAALLRPVTTGSYLNPDKEHLFFFVFALELPEGSHFPRRAEMHPFPLAELVAVRESQALRMAARLCRVTGVPQRSWAAAAEVVALNLALHDHADLGDRIRSLVGHPAAELAGPVMLIDRLVAERTTPSWASASREVPLVGIASWQYREFFSVLLPLYAEMGVHGAADLYEEIQADDRKRDALDQLAARYQDEDFMALAPIEV